MSFRMFIKFSRWWFRDRSITFYVVIFLTICVGMLIPGLCSFNSRSANKVAWLGDRNGVIFYGYAIRSADFKYIYKSSHFNSEPNYWPILF
jgi:hypothetical protein